MGEKGWALYGDVEELMQRQQPRGRYSFQGNGLGGADDESATTTTAEPYDSSFPPTSLPPTPSVASRSAGKRRFSVLETDSVEDDSGPAITTFPFSPSRGPSSHDSLSYRTTSSSSKRGRITGSIALTNIGHSIQDLGASYRQSLENKATRHQDLMAQMTLQMTHQEQQLELQGRQLDYQLRREEEERKERQERVQQRQEAIELALKLETYLSDDELAALLDVFQKEEGSASSYLSITANEGLRKAWVKRKITFASVIMPPPL